MVIEIVEPAADELGECPVWRADAQDLLRVDINGPAIVAAGRRRRLPAPVGFALPARDGGLVAGVGLDLVRLADLDAAPERRARIGEAHVNRFNDAACDAHGRLWAGTMSTTRVAGTAALYRVEADSPPAPAIAGATISNGLGWSLDETRMYYIDSVTQRVDALDFDAERGRLGRRRAFAHVEPDDGLPDGLCVDAEGGVWVALFGGGAIRRYLPSGRLDAHVPLPVSCPTSLAFGGPGLDELYVTSSRHRLTAAQRAAEPAAGSLLRLRPGVTGRLTHAFAGA
ncbi:MAG TPA: SMP-30/gluconolactonase/LRE family protein [Solirubrobacter sp.]|nr:SMP-30/gluconolactonase/LRE family protein [Solirubrobacter sp.]